MCLSGRAPQVRRHTKPSVPLQAQNTQIAAPMLVREGSIPGTTPCNSTDSATAPTLQQHCAACGLEQVTQAATASAWGYFLVEVL